ncbi:MAG: alpha/beta fold hydrolase [Rhizomicrobium sp.]
MTQPRFIATRDGKRLRTEVFDAASGTTGRGVCVLLHGQTEFIEKYVEVIGELRERGFTVATFDWPGQGGSYRMLADPLKAHIGSFSEYDAALWLFMEEVVKPLTDKPPVALAHSMGGHILLRALHDRPNAFKCAVLSAPMLRALTRGYPRWLARAACFIENQIGARNDWVWGMDERDPHKVTFDTQLVTSDRARFQRTQDFLRAHPDLRLAGPSWGWLEAAYRSMARVLTPAYAAAISTPVLICAAGKDRIVDVTAEHEFVKWLPKGELFDMPQSEHEILMESDPIRARFWSAFDAFVGKFI